jgi:hypothetical protein
MLGEVTYLLLTTLPSNTSSSSVLSASERAEVLRCLLPAPAGVRSSIEISSSVLSASECAEVLRCLFPAGNHSSIEISSSKVGGKSVSASPFSKSPDFPHFKWKSFSSARSGSAMSSCAYLFFLNTSSALSASL